MKDLIDLVLVFSRLSFVAFGGGIGILPEMERAVVGGHGWVTHQQFIDAFALSQVTPGPGMLMVVMIGYRAAGLPGALVAGVSMFAPTGALTWLVADRWSQLGDRPVMTLIRGTLSPVALGLLSAGCYTLFRLGVGSVTAAILATAAFAAVAGLKMSPALAVVAGAIVGMAFLR
ncbi:MAG TPA: chromate transporter [Tepidiformaceae bacterium]